MHAISTHVLSFVLACTMAHKMCSESLITSRAFGAPLCCVVHQQHKVCHIQSMEIQHTGIYMPFTLSLLAMRCIMFGCLNYKFVAECAIMDLWKPAAVRVGVGAIAGCLTYTAVRFSIEIQCSPISSAVAKVAAAVAIVAAVNPVTRVSEGVRGETLSDINKQACRAPSLVHTFSSL